MGCASSKNSGRPSELPPNDERGPSQVNVVEPGPAATRTRPVVPDAPRQGPVEPSHDAPSLDFRTIHEDAPLMSPASHLDSSVYMDEEEFEREQLRLGRPLNLVVHAFLAEIGMNHLERAFLLCGYDDALQLQHLEESDLATIEDCTGRQILPGHRKKILLHSANFRKLTNDASRHVARSDRNSYCGSAATPARTAATHTPQGQHVSFAATVGASSRGAPQSSAFAEESRATGTSGSASVKSAVTNPSQGRLTTTPSARRLHSAFTSSRTGGVNSNDPSEDTHIPGVVPDNILRASLGRLEPQSSRRARSFDGEGSENTPELIGTRSGAPSSHKTSAPDHSDTSSASPKSDQEIRLAFAPPPQPSPSKPLPSPGRQVPRPKSALKKNGSGGEKERVRIAELDKDKETTPDQPLAPALLGSSTPRERNGELPPLNSARSLPKSSPRVASGIPLPPASARAPVDRVISIRQGSIPARNSVSSEPTARMSAPPSAGPDSARLPGRSRLVSQSLELLGTGAKAAVEETPRLDPTLDASENLAPALASIKKVRLPPSLASQQLRSSVAPPSPARVGSASPAPSRPPTADREGQLRAALTDLEQDLVHRAEAHRASQQLGPSSGSRAASPLRARSAVGSPVKGDGRASPLGATASGNLAELSQVFDALQKTQELKRTEAVKRTVLADIESEIVAQVNRQRGITPN